MGLQSAYVFVKPHANNAAVIEEVKKKFAEKEIGILKEGEITGETIDAKQYIDQHYYAIASKATILKPDALNCSGPAFLSSCWWPAGGGRMSSAASSTALPSRIDQRSIVTPAPFSSTSCWMLARNSAAPAP